MRSGLNEGMFRFVLSEGFGSGTAGHTHKKASLLKAWPRALSSMERLLVDGVFLCASEHGGGLRYRFGRHIFVSTLLREVKCNQNVVDTINNSKQNPFV